jgi:hypothetical protein
VTKTTITWNLTFEKYVEHTKVRSSRNSLFDIKSECYFQIESRTSPLKIFNVMRVDMVTYITLFTN